MNCSFRRSVKAGLFGLFLTCCAGQASATGATLSTIGSRGTVTASATMFGGFTLNSTTNVLIAVRGPSLLTLGATQNPLVNPGLRLFNSNNIDLLTNTAGSHELFACTVGTAARDYYAFVRGQPLDLNDTCTNVHTLPAGVYTFTITPKTGGSDTSGEVLFEVTFNP